MRLFKNRPLFSAALILMGTSLAGFFLVTPAKLLLLSCLTLGAVLTGAYGLWRKGQGKGMPKYLSLLLCGLLCAAPALLQSLWSIDRREAVAEAYAGQSCTLEATVTEYRGGGSHLTSYTLDVSSVNGTPCRYKALLTCYYVADLRPGYTISILGEGLSLSEAAGDIYEEYALLSDGIFGGFISMSESDYTILSTTPSSLHHHMARHRAELSASMAQRFGEAGAGLPQALLLGEKRYLEDHTERDFARTGVSHLLAISGLHMTLLFGLLALLLKCLRIPPRVRALMLGICAAGYLIYLGFPPSATRAVIMLGMTYLSCLCFTDADPLTSLGLAGICILTVFPTSVADIGFWMSFSATLGLLVIVPLWSKKSAPQRPGLTLLRRGLGGWISGCAAITFSLWVTAPIFGEISLLSAPMTLLLTPLVGLLLLLTPISLLTAALPVAPLLTEAIQGLCGLITQVCEAGARPSWAVVSLRHCLIPILALVMVATTLLLLGLSLKRKGLIALPMLLGWVLIFSVVCIQRSLSSDSAKVSYLIPSSTSELLVLTRGQEGVIFDFSNGSHRAFLTAAKEASHQGATELSAVILTDYHARTSGSLLQLCRRELVRVLWLPKPTSADDYYLMLACLEVAEVTDTPAVIYEHGQELTLFGSAVMTLERAEISRSVQPLLLMTLKTPSDSLVFCGRSILESELALSVITQVSNARTVIFSNRGPTLKAPIQCNFTDTLQRLYLATPTVAAYLSPSHYPSESVSVTVGQGRWHLHLTE